MAEKKSESAVVAKETAKEEVPAATKPEVNPPDEW